MKFKNLSLPAFLSCLMLLSFNSYAQKGNMADQPDLSKDIPFNSDFTKGKLKNGLTYYVKHNDKPENKVELRLVINAGSILETDKQQGLAHLMEHMNFNGTKNFQKNQLVDYLQSIGVKFGADLNAYTGFDQTVFILPIPSDDPEKLEKGFQIIEDWAHNATLETDAINDERGVVMEEFRLGLGAQERMRKKYFPKLFYKSRYAKRLPIGKKEVIEHSDPSEIRDFYHTWYRPDLQAVIAVGDLPVDEMVAKIKEHFAKIPEPKNPKPRPTYDVPNHKKTLISIASDKEASQSLVRIMNLDTKNYSPEKTLKDYRHGIIESLFSQMINNRLSELRNGNNPPFIFGYSYHGGTSARTKEAYQSIAATSPDGQLKALQTLLEENKRVKEHGFYKGEFERAKSDLMSHIKQAYKERDKQKSSSLVGEAINNYLENEPMPGITWEYNFYQKELPTIKLSEVSSLISDYIKNENRVIVLTGPENDKTPKVTKAQVEKVLKTVENETVTPYEDKEVSKEFMKTMPKAGSVTKTETNDKLGTTTWTLSNGAKVTFKKTDFKNDQIMFRAFSYGGTSLYSDADYKATNFANGGVTDAGVNGFDQNTMDKMMSGKVASVRPYLGSYSEGFNGSAAPDDLETLFQLTHLYFTSINEDKDAYNSYLTKQKAQVAAQMANPQFYFINELQKMIGGKNPRFMGMATVEKLDKANYDLAYKKYKESFSNAGNFHFYFVGNVNPAKLKKYSETYLASLPSGTEQNYKVRDFRPLTGSHSKVVKRGQSPKSLVLLLFEGETKYSKKDAMAIKALGDVLSIKLTEVLREKESGVYSVNAGGNIQKTPYPWYTFQIVFPCGPENVAKLKTSALEELQKIIDNGPTSEDVEKVKQTDLVEHKVDMKKNSYWISHLKNADYNKENPDDLLDYNKMVNDLTAQDIQNIAKKYLNGGHIEAILKPADKK